MEQRRFPLGCLAAGAWYCRLNAWCDDKQATRVRTLPNCGDDRDNRIVVFTGAGISTESGIPDFRSPGGIWTKMRPIDFSDFLASEEMRRESWRRRFGTDQTMRQAEPNRGHRAISTLVRRGKVSAVITQNIDGLHQASGVPANRVIELHGNTTYAHCLDCAQRYEIEDIRVEFERTGEAPNCNACGGFIRHDNLVRPVDAARSYGRAGRRRWRRSVHRHRIVAGGVSGSRLSRNCRAQRGAAGDPGS